jgi:outer membrane protein
VSTAALLLLTGVATHAQSLAELLKTAQDTDATFQSAQANRAATLARAEQARAALLPTVNLGANASRTSLEIPTANIARMFGTQGATVSAAQPLYRPANAATARQGEQTALLAELQLQAASQDLIVRVSQGYFDVLGAQDSLTYVRAQKAAVAEQLAAAKRNFEVGTSTITDSREAQARFDLVTAQEIAAENDLRVKRLALDQLTGQTNALPTAIAPGAALPDLSPLDANAWVQQAEQQHPTIRQAAVALEVARLETVKAQAGHKPTLDAVASYNLTRNINGSSTSGASSRSNATTLGLSFNLPLFAGFATENRIKETLALEAKAEADLEVARRAIAQATRAAFFGVQSGMGQVKALEAAEASSQSALDANKLGYQVGVRINIDVLNSQSQLFQTKRDLAKARYDVLLGGLKLRQANGTLSGDDIRPITGLLMR